MEQPDPTIASIAEECTRSTSTMSRIDDVNDHLMDSDTEHSAISLCMHSDFMVHLVIEL